LKLFYDDEFDALNQMVTHSDKSAKDLAVFLFPHLKMESAYARLKACLNPEKDERLTFGQIIAAMNFCGTFDPLMFACHETSHSTPEPVAADDEQARMVMAVENATATLAAAAKQLERLQKRGYIKGVERRQARGG